MQSIDIKGKIKSDVRLSLEWKARVYEREFLRKNAYRLYEDLAFFVEDVIYHSIVTTVFDEVSDWKD